MASSPGKRLARRLSGACFALLALVILSSGEVRAAGCVHDRPIAAHFEHLTRAGAIPAASEHRSQAPAPPVPTCSGPMCSRGPAAPPLTSGDEISGVDSWALLAAEPLANPSDSSPLPCDETPAPGQEREDSIFHPPRSLAR